MQLLKYVGTIALLMLASTIFKSAEVIVKKQFDWRLFFQGVFKHLLICVGVICMYLAGIINNVEIIDGKTIVDLIDMFCLALIVKQGMSCYENVKAIYGVTVEIINEKFEDVNLEERDM